MGAVVFPSAGSGPAYLIGNTSSRPSAPASGTTYYNTTYGTIQIYNGSTWENLKTDVSTFWNIEYLVVGGGGGGGNSGTSGGGGAGGLLTGTATQFAVGDTFTVTVGNGGAAATNGSNSVFGSLTAIGGGKGGSQSAAGSSGGSGGGGGSGSGAGAAGTANQGNAGGNGHSSTDYQGGAGGGAGGAGNNGSTAANGAGQGLGLASSITGSSVTYAQGGGGGNGGAAGGTSGLNSTLKGGGGGGNGSNNSGAGAGVAGIVILAYPSTYPALTTIPGGLTYTVSTSSRTGYRVYSFTAGTGTVTI